MVTALAVAGFGAGVPLIHAATTTEATARYAYNHSVTFALAGYGSPLRLAASPARSSVALHAVNHVGNAAEDGSVWTQGLEARGLATSDALGGNLPRSFPVIHRFEGGVATSTKSIDLTAPSYQSVGALTSRLTGYVDRVASFNGARFSGVNIRPDAIAGRALDIAIEPGVASTAQEQALSSIVRYGAQRGVTVKVVPFG